MSTEQLPREILEKAVKLRNCVRDVFITLYSCKEPKTAVEIAGIVGKVRPYVNMRLQTLVDMGLAKRTKQGRKNLFEVSLT